MARGLVPSRPFPTCLRRPYLFSRKRKDREEKSAWTRLVHSAVRFRQESDLQILRTHILPLRALWYAPPVTGRQICEQLPLNGCGENALHLKFAGQYGFAGVL